MSVNKSNVKNLLHDAVILPGTCEYTLGSDPLCVITRDVVRHSFR